MATGLKLPVGVDSSGGTAMVSGEENDRKTLWTSLSDCENEHAFQQDLGLGNFMIFGISNSKIRAKILRKLATIFGVFEADKRYRLKEESIEWEKVEGTGDLRLKFEYINLETEEVKSFQRVYSLTTGTEEV